MNGVCPFEDFGTGHSSDRFVHPPDVLFTHEGVIKVSEVIPKIFRRKIYEEAY